MAKRKKAVYIARAYHVDHFSIFVVLFSSILVQLTNDGIRRPIQPISIWGKIFELTVNAHLCRKTKMRIWGILASLMDREAKSGWWYE